MRAFGLFHEIQSTLRKLSSQYTKYNKYSVYYQNPMKGAIRSPQAKQNMEQMRLELQRKFNTYKSQKLEPQTLTQISRNIDQEEQIEDTDKMNEVKKINLLLAYNQQQVLELMMGDEKLKKISTEMKEQAEKKYKEKILKTLPTRYKTLLEKQMYLNTLQTKHEELKEQHNQKVNKMNSTIEYLEGSLRELSTQKELEHKRWQSAIDSQTQELKEVLRKKDYEIMDKNEEIVRLNEKLSKSNNKYLKLNEIVIQLRQQQTQLSKQNERLINRLQQSQNKVQRGYKKVLQLQAELKVLRSSMDRIIEQETKLIKQTVQKRDEEIRNLNQKIEFKDSLIELLENQKEKILANYDAQQKQRYQQIQQIRQQYLQSLQTIDSLQQQLDQKQTEVTNQQTMFNTEKQRLKKQLDDRYLIIGEYKINLDSKQNQVFTLEQKIQAIVIRHQLEVQKLSAEMRKSREQVNQKYGEKFRALMAVNQELIKEKEEIMKRLQQVQEQNNGDFMKIQNQVELYSEQMTKKQEKLLIKTEEYSNLNSYLVNENTRLSEEITLRDKKIEEISANRETDNPPTKYEQIIEKLKIRIIQISKNYANQSKKQQKLFKQMLVENKSLKKMVNQLQKSY